MKEAQDDVGMKIKAGEKKVTVKDKREILKFC